MMLLELRQNGILDDRIYNAISSLSRKDFLPKNLVGLADENIDLKIFDNVIASKTSDIAKMIYLGLSCNNNVNNVLEIGTGSGWQTAILSKIYKRVYTIELNKDAYNFSRKIFEKFSNKISFKFGDGKKGWSEAAPFDAIYIDCCLNKEPINLYSDVNMNEGVIVTVNKYENKQFYCSCMPHNGKGFVKSNYEVDRTLII